jgi:hypothetical protein
MVLLLRVTTVLPWKEYCAMDLVKRNFKLRVIARKLLSIRPQADLVQQRHAADTQSRSFLSIMVCARR